jgi:hypothetical protein
MVSLKQTPLEAARGDLEADSPVVVGPRDRDPPLIEAAHHGRGRVTVPIATTRGYDREIRLHLVEENAAGRGFAAMVAELEYLRAESRPVTLSEEVLDIGPGIACK